MRKNVIVIGGSGEIGKRISLDLVNDGYTVIFTYHDNQSKACDLLNQLNIMNKECTSFKLDVSDAENVQSFAQMIKQCFGQVYGLVNSAGISPSSDMLVDMPESMWYKIININLTGVFLVCKYILPLMNNGGRIINISSIHAKNPPAMRTAYGTSKAGILGLSIALSKEVAHRQICVNTICPGPIETEMLDKIWEITANKKGISFDNFKEDKLKGIPLKKLGKTSDVSNVVKFLMSDLSNHITGSTIDINGGEV